MALFSGQTYGSMASVLEQDSNGKMRISPDQYDTFKASLEQGSPEQQLSAKFLDYMGKDDPDNMIDLALTGMGISWEDLQNNPNETFDKKAQSVIVQLNTLYEYMQENNKDINPEGMSLITSYIKGSSKHKLEELDSMGVFEKRILTINEEEKTRLRAMVEQMDISDPKEKENILNGLYQFYEDWPSADSFTRDSIKLEKTSNNIYLESYGQKTEINLETKTLPGLNQKNQQFNLTFASSKEVLNVANLTNRIKGLSKNHPTTNTAPFGLSNAGINIPFTDI
jgi:hemerythrin